MNGPRLHCPWDGSRLDCIGQAHDITETGAVSPERYAYRCTKCGNGWGFNSGRMPYAVFQLAHPDDISTTDADALVTRGGIPVWA